ncbi:MAG: hypothetical protein O7B35_08320 [Deltaproteobacteria bacterium]|nr:hypothetical protein [Deltaproteobacteria bacterium]
MLKVRIIHLQIVLFIILGLNLVLPSAEARLIGKPAPEINNQVWINSPALKMADLRGKVVLLQFWTYG